MEFALAPKRTKTYRYPDLGALLHERRERLGLSAEYVASKLGVSASAVAYWERGEAAPTLGRLAPLADVLGCDVAKLARLAADPIESAA